MTDNNAHPLTPWTPGDYAPHVQFSGAQKLADSGVAPLVAAARGYETIEKESVKDFAKTHALGASNSTKFKQVAQSTIYGDTMVILWYQADLVAAAHDRGAAPVFTTMQLRPSVPKVNPTNGKTVKYENLTGSGSVIDIHPSTPKEWYLRSSKILITEGVIKGDSALTAQLRTVASEEELLGIGHTATRTQALTRVTELMGRIPERERVTIISFVGVGNWKNNEVWVSMPLSGRTLYLAFDGDIASNWNVWSQANNLWGYAKGKGSIVKLLDLHIESDLDSEAAELIRSEKAGTKFESGEKVGLDDYLAKHGDWNSLVKHRILDDLPDTPARSRDDAPIGTWKVSEDGTSVQEYAAQKDPITGQETRPQWEVRYNIGGRIDAVETHRAPTQREVETANFGEGVAEEDVPMRSTVRIELSWMNDAGIKETAVITGPNTILMYPPSEWDKKRAEIPNNLLLHSEWPPRKGLEWLSAIKDNNDIPVRQNVSWTTMGYVPVEGSPVCSFISGKTVIAPTKEDAEKTVAGVTEVVLPGSTKFSLPAPEHEYMSEGWIKQVREDLRDVRHNFFENGVWTDQNVPAVLVAAGLRPTVPIPTTTVLYVQGPPGQGKSYSVSMILAFHQARKTWTNKMLPGSMKDTGTSVEQALSQTNVWVMDDLAPSADRRQADMEQSKLGDIIRSVHNKTAKRRSGTELKAREVFEPRALLIATAENEHSINSVRDRTVILNLDKNSLTDTADDMAIFRDKSKAPARITYAAVQLIQAMAMNESWERVLKAIEATMDEYKTAAEKVIGKKITSGKSISRHVGMAVDLMAGLVPLALLADMVDDQEMLDLLDTRKRNNLQARISEIVAGSFRSQAEVTPGRSLMEAIRNVIASGHAHILNANDPGLQPMPNGSGSENRQLGWSKDGQDKPRPLGECIGYLVGDDAVFFDYQNAFNIAQRRNPTQLPPGTSAPVSFGSLWNEGLAHERYKDKGGKGIGRVFRLDGRSKRGVPVHIDLMLGSKLPDAPEPEEDDPFDDEEYDD